MKIAICFSGHIRSLKQTSEFWKNFIQKNNIDVYGSFWEPETTEDIIDKNIFIELLNPKKVEFEHYNYFKETSQDIFSSEVIPPYDLNAIEFNLAKSCNYFAMWYKIWRANMLAKSDKYDIVIRARTDAIPHDEIIFNINDYLSLPTRCVEIIIWLNCIGPSDVFAFGNPKLMDYYSSLFFYLTRYLKEGHYLYPSENILKVHLAQKYIIINQCINNIHLIKNGSVVNLDGDFEIYNSIVDTTSNKSFYVKNTEII